MKNMSMCMRVINSMNFDEVKEGQKFIVTKGSYQLAHRVDYGGDFSKFSKRVTTGTILEITAISEKINDPRYKGKRREVFFDLGGEKCWATWGNFKRVTKPISENPQKAKRKITLTVEVLSDSDTSDMPPYEFLRIAAQEMKGGARNGKSAQGYRFVWSVKDQVG